MVADCAGSLCGYMGRSRSPWWGLLEQELGSPLGRGTGNTGTGSPHGP